MLFVGCLTNLHVMFAGCLTNLHVMFAGCLTNLHVVCRWPHLSFGYEPLPLFRPCKLLRVKKVKNFLCGLFLSQNYTKTQLQQIAINGLNFSKLNYTQVIGNLFREYFNMHFPFFLVSVGLLCLRVYCVCWPTVSVCVVCLLANCVCWPTVSVDLLGL